jgi:nicotinamide-nucleotide amidase
MNLINKKVVKLLLKKKFKISLAESCTGGLMSSAITSVPGASKVFKVGFVTYSNEAKINTLGVSKLYIKKYGAVSKEVCLNMLKNVARIGKSKIALSITGIAGPGGGTINKPVGLVYIGIKKNTKSYIKTFIFKNKSRKYIQNATVTASLKLILSIIE